eukprot:403336617
MQNDLNSWVQKSGKEFKTDLQMTFDGGNCKDGYVASSQAFSKALSAKLYMALASAVFNTHPRLGFVRTSIILPIKPYEKRAFQWHHDGWGKGLLKVMILLTDIPDDGQRMRYCPSTNQIDWNCSRSKQTQFADTFVQKYQYVNICGKAGDVYMFMPNGMHSGTRNMSVRRDVCIFDFVYELKRNYAVPGFHPEIEEKMSKYQKLILRTNEKEAIIHLEDHDKKNDEFLLQAQKSLIIDKEYTKEEFDLCTQRSLMLSSCTKNIEIQEIGDQNMIVPFIDFPIFRADIENNEEYFQKFQREFYGGVQVSIIDQHEKFKGSYSDSQMIVYLQEQIQRDSLGDFDFPLEMEHPNHDLIRDCAIVTLRDDNKGIQYERLNDQLKSLDYRTSLQSLDYSVFTKSLDNLLLIRPVFLKILNLQIQDNSSKQKQLYFDYYSIFSLIQNIETMLKRCIQADQLRINICYLYFCSVLINEGVLNIIPEFIANNYQELEYSMLKELQVDEDKLLRNYLALIIYHKFNDDIE